MIDKFDIAWAAGFLEGEGAFGCRGHSVTVQVSQVQKEPLERLQAMFGGTLTRYTRINPRHSPWYFLQYTGPTARGLMMTLYVLMSPKRKGQIRKALGHWRAVGRSLKWREHCRRGHLLAGENIYQRSDRRRNCRACNAMRTPRNAVVQE